MANGRSSSSRGSGEWTGEKRAKIQSAPSITGDLGDTARTHSSGGQEQIEGLDWDSDKLQRELISLFERLNDGPPDPDDDDDESLAFCDEQQLKALNQRLALYRIRAHEEKYRGMDDASLLAVFPPSHLEDNWYYKYYHRDFQWCFDPVGCEYAHLQDYRRLMLPDNGEYEDWEYYHKTCSTLEGDQEFVWFWEELSSKTELIELYLARRSRKELGHWKLLFYHGLKLAEGYPHVYKYLIRSALTEFAHREWLHHSRDKYYIGFLFDMWQLVAEQKMGFKDALRQVHSKGNTVFIFACTDVFEPNLPSMEKRYKPHLDRIVEKAQEGHDVHQLIKDTVRKIVKKPNTYYDYAKKKLGIAEEIRLIPPQLPTLKDRPI